MNKTSSTQPTFESIMAIMDRTERRQEAFEKLHEKRAAEAEVRRKEYEVSHKELEEQVKRTSENIDKLNKEIGGISNNNGYSAEEYFFNALDATRKLGNIKFDFIERNRKRHTGKVQDEFDIVMFNGSSVAIIEVKYRAHQNSLQHLTTKKVQNFRTLYPEYAHHKLYLGIASMSFNAEVIKGAKKLGIGILQQKGDTLECDTEHIKAY
ncbi:hypothetical protein FACS1894199_10420 [Bacteroidia bacterium]|nr:hypothetical protein FACS1894199_10420 [Bacteroidia bacterium]